MGPLYNFNDAERYLRKRLRKMGFSEAAGLLHLKELIAEQGSAKRFYTVREQAPDLYGTNYTWNIERIGDFWHLHSVELSKVLSHAESGRTDRTISETYYNDFMFEDRKALDEDFRFVVQNVELRDDLRSNSALRDQVTKMGFDYDLLVAQAQDISGPSPGNRRDAIMYERIPITINASSHPIDVWVVFNLVKDGAVPYKVNFMEAGTHRGILNSKDPSLVVAYPEKAEGFPHKNEIIREITARENIFQTSTKKAYKLLNKIKGGAFVAKELSSPRRKP
jgi:hypothetical protein